MAMIIDFAGYHLKLRERSMRWRKRDAKGKACGFWEGKRVYLYVQGPDGHEREIALGSDTKSVGADAAKQGRRHAQDELELVRARSGRDRGQGPGVSDTDLYAPHFERDRRAIAKARRTHNGRSVNKKRG